MASNLIFRIASQFDAKGTEEAAKGLKNVQQQMRQMSKASEDAGQSFERMFSVIKGTAMALPLAGFIKEAIQSEEITARFSMRLKMMGEDASDVMSSIEGMGDRIHKAGVSQTEFIQALSTGARFFKSTAQEMALLDTAIGMTKTTSISLAGAFQQLGMISQGITRTARQYGVSMHTEIRDPTLRGAAVIADMTKKMAEMAGQTGTTSEKLKEAGATIKDLGEKIGLAFVKPIGDVAGAFNKLSESTKEIVIRAVLVGGALIGVQKVMLALIPTTATTTYEFASMGAMMSYMSKEGATAAVALRGIGAALATIGKAVGILAIIAGISIIVQKYQEMKDAQKEQAASEKAYADQQKSWREAKLGDLSKEIDITSDLEGQLKELGKLRSDLAGKELLARKEGRTADAETAKEERGKLAVQIEGIKNLEEAKKAIGLRTITDLDNLYKKATLGQHQYELNLIKNKYQAILKSDILDSEQKKKLLSVAQMEVDKANKDELKRQAEQARDIASLRIELMADGLDKELAEVQLKAEKERTAMLDTFKNSLDVRKLLTEKSAKDELAIRVKYLQAEFDKTVELALMSSSEKKQFEVDRAKAQELLRGSDLKDLERLSDADKAFLKESKAGQEELAKWSKQQIEEQAKGEQELTAMRKKEEAKPAELAKEWETRRALVEKETELAKEQKKLAEGMKGGYYKTAATQAELMGGGQKETLMIFEEMKSSQEKTVEKLEEEIKLLQGGLVVKKEEGLKESELTAEGAKQAAQVALSNVVSITITPNAGEFASAAAEAARSAVAEGLQKFQADLDKRFK